MKAKLLKRIEELERKVKELEMRQPITIINNPIVPPPIYQPVPLYPNINPSPWYCDKTVIS